MNRISISVGNPLRVAIALAEIWGGYCLPLYPLPNSYAVLASIEYGATVEIYPTDTEFCVTASEAALEFFNTMLFAQPLKTCGAIAVATTHDDIERVAARERWRTRSYRFGLFEIVEVWVENQFVLALLPKGKASSTASTIAGRFMPLSLNAVR